MTLIETLVAIAIMSIVVLSVTSIIVGVGKSERHDRAASETDWEASFILSNIAQSIRNATSVTAPAVGSSSSSLTLSIPNITAENPTVYSTSSQVINVSKGGLAATRLSSPNVTVANLSLQNIKAIGTKGAVRITLSLSYANPSNRPELVYSVTRYLTISIR